MLRKRVLFLVEGSTEEEFYKAIIKYAHDKMNAPFPCDIDCKDMKGIGNYKKDALRRFKAEKKKHPKQDIYVYLCIDTDAFEFSKKPPIDKDAVKKCLEDNGAKKVEYIEARQSIEDWFLCDLSGVLRYLKLPLSTVRPKGNGQVALKKLFKSAGKVYSKGTKVEGFVEYLDIAAIIHSCCGDLEPLCKAIPFDCSAVCNKTKTSSKQKD